MDKKIKRVHIVTIWFAGLIILIIGGFGIIFSQNNSVPQWFVGLSLLVFFIGFFIYLSFPVALYIDWIRAFAPKRKIYQPKEALITENEETRWS